MGQLLFHRLFFALLPPPGAAREMGALRDADGPWGRRVGNARLHMTLLMIGNFDSPPDDRVAAILAALPDGALPACRVVLDRPVRDPEGVRLAPSEPLRGVRRLYRELRALLVRAGIAPAQWWRLSPHVTLRYIQGTAGGRAIDPISWRAGELVLVHSLVGEGLHIPCGRWPLSAADRGAAIPASFSPVLTLLG
jgi:2'-5' RNA ligase